MCLTNSQCSNGKKCILHQCVHETKYCDVSGKCPDGYKNFWGKCLTVPNQCNRDPDCPPNTLCNPADGVCYMIPCWRDDQCQVTVKMSSKKLPNCFRPTTKGHGLCYK